jgi:hypothetical protein
MIAARCPPVIPTLRRLRQEDGEFEVNLGYIARPCLKIIQNKLKQNNNNSNSLTSCLKMVPQVDISLLFSWK